MDWERIEPWDYIVVAVASQYHNKYPIVELEDIKQSLYQWFLEHPNKLNEWEAIGGRDAKNLIYRSLRNQALDYCQRWKAKTNGYELSDIFYYNPEVVEILMPSVLRRDLTVTPQLNLDSTSGGGTPSEGGNLMSMMIEIDVAYHKLSNSDKHVLFLRYGEQADYHEMADVMELGTDDAARMRVKRALSRLINKLGGFRPFKDEDSDEEEKTTPEIEVSKEKADSENDYEK